MHSGTERWCHTRTIRLLPRPCRHARDLLCTCTVFAWTRWGCIILHEICDRDRKIVFFPIFDFCGAYSSILQLAAEFEFHHFSCFQRLWLTCLNPETTRETAASRTAIGIAAPTMIVSPADRKSYLREPLSANCMLGSLVIVLLVAIWRTFSGPSVLCGVLMSRLAMDSWFVILVKLWLAVVLGVVSDRSSKEFEAPEEASAALNALDGTDFHGSALKVQFSLDRKRQPGEGRCFICNVTGHWFVVLCFLEQPILFVVYRARECPRKTGGRDEYECCDIGFDRVCSCVTLCVF